MQPKIYLLKLSLLPEIHLTFEYLCSPLQAMLLGKPTTQNDFVAFKSMKKKITFMTAPECVILKKVTLKAKNYKTEPNPLKNLKKKKKIQILLHSLAAYQATQN